MPTVFSADGFRFQIYSDDHDPPHVHVHGNGSAKVMLDGPHGPYLAFKRGMSDADGKKIVARVRERRADLLEMWMTIHGRAD